MENEFSIFDVSNIIEEVHLNHSSIPESASKKLYNSICRIEIDKSIATGFFIKFKVKEIELRFLVTNFHVISQKDVNLNKTFRIYFGEKEKENSRTINLNINERFIRCYPRPTDITIISILNTDNIQENKFLIPDLNYKNGFDIYYNKDFYLAGYPKSDIFKKERHCSSGKIKKIDNYMIIHSLDTEAGSSGSPICLLENQLVIAIHRGGRENKKENYGTFIGYVIDQLNQEDINNYNVIYNFINQNKIIEKNKYFFTFEEYNDKIYNYHKMIAKYFINQNENYFDVSFIDVNYFLKNSNLKLGKKQEDFLSELEDFKNIDVNFKKIIFESEIIKDINNLLSSDFEKTIENFGYFIAGIMYSLEKCGNSLFCELKIDSLLYNKFEMDYSDLKIFEKNKSQIISFKTFLSELTTLEHLHGQLFRVIKDSKFFIYKFFNDTKYTVSFKINYKYNQLYKSNCFSVSKSFPEKIFQYFSFFKIKNVTINENKYEAEIELDSIPRKEVIEEKLCDESKINYLSYNRDENLLEILEDFN